MVVHSFAVAAERVLAAVGFAVAAERILAVAMVVVHTVAVDYIPVGAALTAVHILVALAADHSSAVEADHSPAADFALYIPQTRSCLERLLNWLEPVQNFVVSRH